MQTATDINQGPEKSPYQYATLQRGTIHAMLEGVAITMSKDGTRPHLNGVLFVFEREALTLVSTDGHRLTKVQSAYTLDEANPNETKRFLIPAVRVDLILKAVKGAFKVSDEPVSFELSGNRFDLIMLSGDRYTCQDNDDVTFPPYDKVIPKERSTDGKEGCNVIGISAKYLGDVGKAGRRLAHVKSGGVRFSVDGDRDPVRIDMTNTDLGTETVIVIMPMRI
jgi:DNA polymerase-3 subunit beta